MTFKATVIPEDTILFSYFTVLLAKLNEKTAISEAYILGTFWE